MNIKQAFTLIMVVAIFVIGTFLVGCTGADGATEAEDKESIEATPAANESEESGKKKDGDKRKRAKDGDKDTAKKEEAVPVEVSELALGPIESVLAFSANLEAESEVSVVAEAQRQVIQLLVEEGDHVSRGQVLLRLQNDEQTSALGKVKSQVEKAEREFVREERLYEQELISEEDFSNAKYDLEQLRIEMADAERELSYTDVRAPISGIVAARMVNLGDQVQIGQELFELIDFDSIVARIYVPEKHLTQLRTGLPANVTAQAAAGLDYDCTVKRIAPIVDAKSGTVKVTVAVGSKPGLRPGMYVDVNLVTTTHNEAVLVPKRAVVYDNDQMYVYRVRDKNRVERVFFQPLLTDKYNVEPVSGLSEGDRIVIAGQAGLKEGALVKLAGEDQGAIVEPAEPDENEVVERASL